jgi:thiazole biosynthesis enzyme
MIDERIVTKAIIERYTEKLLSCLEIDVAICGAGPSGLVAAYYLAKKGLKTVIFERKLSIGGGMWGGGMMFNEIVVQDAGKAILDEMGIAAKQYKKGYHVADAVECVSGLTYRAMKAGAKIFNLISVEDLVVRKEKVTGVVINWTAVEMASLHVDPLTIMSKFVVDSTGHPLEVVRVLERKMNVRLNTPSGKVEGERSMWADVAETTTLENTQEVFPGLYVAGMSANATFGSYRMGPIFGGMLLSGRKVAELIAKRIK